jgi:hypothetical protein
MQRTVSKRALALACAFGASAGARALADDAAARARAALEQVDADTSVLAGIVDDLAVRTV